MHKISMGYALVAAAALFASVAHAGPFTDFEAAMHKAYGSYRVALFQTNAQNAEKSAESIEAFTKGWGELTAAYEAAPPQYADDATYQDTMGKVAEIAEAARKEVAEGKFAEAHETLESIREEIAGLHERNGLINYSDRMNAYHAMMEEVLAKDYTGYDETGMGTLREDAAVLGYLVTDLDGHRPAEAGSPEFEPLLDGVKASVAKLLDATRANDAEAAKAAVGGLKVPYSKFFLEFG